MKFFRSIYPIVTGGLAVVLALAACTPAGSAAPSATAGSIPTAAVTPPETTPAVQADLANTSWILESMGAPGTETAAAGGVAVTLVFQDGGQAGGYGGCNSFNSAYQIRGDEISFSQVISTMRACVDQTLMQQEVELFQALNATGQYTLEGDHLTISYNQGSGTLNFMRSSAAPQNTPTSVVIPGNSTPESLLPPTGGEVGGEDYLDDRSAPEQLVASYFNAINRREYLRAYSYWADPSGSLGSFEEFSQGYADTTSVEVSLGSIGADAGMSQVYYSVPALLTAHTGDGAPQTYAACYVIHFTQPGVLGQPPFYPMRFLKGDARLLDSGEDAQPALAQAGADLGFPAGNPLPLIATTAPDDIGVNAYIDNRSGPVAVLQSLFNAVNRHEYVRAYSYWEVTGLSYETFRDGYAETAAVQLRTGQVSSGVGAGQTYYSVPVVLIAQTTAGETQTFAGCYQMHLASPAIQAQLPFRPLAIQSADVDQVANDSDADALLNRDCSPG
ncbi:MAG: META domain-containing protein [Anaerolineaceae bacterium]|nr:META domain-containing protein [Anaerolineaceae bacterium]